MPESSAPPAPDFAELRERILTFLASCRQPVLKEQSAEPLAIAPDRFTLAIQADALLFDAWDERRTVSRRVIGIREAGADASRSLTLIVRKFAGRQDEIILTETELRGATLDRSLRRKNFREQFRTILNRQFPGAKIDKLSAERDLRRSFSEHYTRALLTQGSNTWAAIGVSDAEGPTAAAAILTQGLLWLDYVRVNKLYLFLPESSAERTVQRLAWLDPARATFHVVPIPSTDLAATVMEPLAQADPASDPANSGNFRTELRSPRMTANIAPDARDKLKTIASFPGVEEEIAPDGAISLRYKGLEVAHAGASGTEWINVPMEKVARIRDANTTEKRNTLYTRAAERWMESIIKRDVSPLSLDVAGSPVYSQVLSGAGQGRGVIDLLTITRTGRLVVIELKADEDQNLPLQALDYWMRVRWHQQRGDFRATNLFPGCEMTGEAPLLWLVFPGIRMHPSNEIVMKYFSPRVPVTRLGINEDWRKGVHVVFRA